jgi:DNA-binding HxlR family transcriptional regulator
MRRGTKTYHSAVELTIDVIGGRWKPLILWILSQGTYRFSELQRALPTITQTMLTKQLRELEEDRIVTRKVYAQVPPRVEYSLSEVGKTVLPLVHALAQWGKEYSETQSRPYRPYKLGHPFRQDKENPSANEH